MDNNFVDVLLNQDILPLPVKCFGSLDIQEIAKAICAFLNGQGGWIIVGINENHKLTGINVDQTSDLVQYEVTNNIAPLPLVYIQKELYKQQEVILVTVMKGSLAPYSFMGKYYVVDDNRVISPSPDQISTLLRNSFYIKSSWESIVNLLGDPNDLDIEQMDKVYKYGLSSNKLTESSNGLFSTLSELQLIDSYEIKNGAVCLFSDRTGATLPQSRLRFQLMSGGKTSDKYDNTLILEGNIFTLLHEAMNYFMTTLPNQSIFIDNKTMRIDGYIYPMDVLREAIGNALIHRDYSDSIGEVSVFLYPNKIEFRNPGRLPDDLVKSKSEVLPHGSILRNPLMAEIFYIAGFMEKTGRGMELISRKMRELGKRLPEWTCSEDYTTLTIFNESVNVLYNDRISAFLKGTQPNDCFTKKDYIEFFEKKPSKITAQTDISKMIEMGVCEKIGKGPATKYKIIDRF